MPLDAVYIDANFKETQLAKLQPGQPVDDRGRRASRAQASTARVASVAPASGSVFSLLPPDNATGNFTKIVQRLPVRIQVPADVAEQARAAARHVGGRRASTPSPARRSPIAAAELRARAPERRISAIARSEDRHGQAASQQQPPRAPAGAAADADDRIDPRRLVAFLAMVFGMFMAILDIQIVSASLTEIQAGLAASANEITWVQTAYLIAEVVMIPLSGFLSRALGTRMLFAISAGGLHRREPDVRALAPRSTR